MQTQEGQASGTAGQSYVAGATIPHDHESTPTPGADAGIDKEADKVSSVSNRPMKRISLINKHEYGPDQHNVLKICPSA